MVKYLLRQKPFGPIDVVTYVPMSRTDRRRRGFNQAQILARSIGRRLGIPVLPLLAKVRETLPQAALSAIKRRENLHEAFRQIRSVKRGRVLLVDDVYTTGATVEECARVLKMGGHRAVFVLTVART
jgi:ComF family protein